jgi:hypothetical protein
LAGRSAPNWLCAECSRPLLDLGSNAHADSDQQLAAGWDALDWTERIAPNCWGSAVEDDPWVLSVRCLAMASVLTGRSSGCAHTGDATVALPVVAIARAPGVLRCPPCAEPVVAQTSSSGGARDLTVAGRTKVHWLAPLRACSLGRIWGEHS